MVKTRGLTHLQITVRDLERSLRFYQGLLGMEEERPRIGGRIAFLSTPGAQDVLTLNANPERSDKAGKMGGISHYGFRLQDAADIDAAVDAALQAGGTLLERGERSATEPFAFVGDPDGYLIEIWYQP